MKLKFFASKRLTAFVLSGVLAAGSVTGAFAADIADFKDIPNDWSRNAIESAIKNNLMVGDNGYIRASDNITRAEVAVILNRMVGAEEKADISAYSDVKSTDWYYDAMAKSVGMGIMSGSDGKLMPEKDITREEAFALIARLLELQDGEEKSLSAFADANDVSSWAKGDIAALVEKGYVAGSDDKLNPKKAITRAEFAQVLANIGSLYIFEPGEYTGNYTGNVFVAAPNVTFTGNVKGNVIVGDGADNVTIKDSEIDGDVLVRGKDVTIDSSNIKGKLDINGAQTAPTIAIDDDSEIGEVHAGSDYISKKEIKDTTGDGKNLYKDDNKVIIGGGGGTVKTTYKYVYAAVPYAEYWAAEDIYNAGSTKTSDEVDSRGEMDKGGFDAVSRATSTHGVHRGSFQQIDTITTAEGNTYIVNSWEEDGSAFYTPDGEKIGFARGGTLTKEDGSTETLEKHVLSGVKYVPVAVSEKDYEDFKKDYAVVENGETLAGGYSENNLVAYTATANVTANTNGLKTVTKTGSGWNFSASKTGTESGIQDESLKTAEYIITTVKPYSGSYGEFLRVDLTGDGYGELGSRLQTVEWTYYGEDASYSKPLQTYGTKFAADNWMHRLMGIQLGLTESDRFQLPENTDGTGYWTLTVHALGYEDFVTQFEVTEENIPAKEVDGITEEQKTELQKYVDEMKDLLDKHGEIQDGENAWSALKDHYDEAVAMLANADATKAEAEELLEELPGLIEAVKDEEPVVKEGSALVAGFNYMANIKVTLSPDEKTILSISDNGTEAGSNISFWQDALNGYEDNGVTEKGMIDKFENLPVASIDEIDAVSEATYSSQAIKQAIKNALGIVDEKTEISVSNWPELLAAAASANEGDTIKLANDITDAGNVDGISSATVALKSGVTLDGNGKTITPYTESKVQKTRDKDGEKLDTPIDIDANFCFYVYGATDVSVKNLTIDGASFSDKVGGAMYVSNGSDITLTDVTFKNCSAAHERLERDSGGAIYIESRERTSGVSEAPAKVVAENCVFENNKVYNTTTNAINGRGGAVAVMGGELTLNNCTFRGNEALWGGAVSAAGDSALTITNCTFEDSNDAVYGGDDVYIYDGRTFYSAKKSLDSNINFTLNNNTHAADGDTYTDYKVILSRITGEIDGEVYNGSGLAATGVMHDLTFEDDDAIRKGAPIAKDDDDDQDEPIVREGSAVVEVYDYIANIKVTLSADGQTILSIEDNGTNTEGNDSFWAQALDGYTRRGITYPGMISKFENLPVSSIEDVDTVSGATYSSKAIINAVKGVLIKDTQSGEELLSPVSLRATDYRTQLIFADTESNQMTAETEDENVDIYYSTADAPNSADLSSWTKADGNVIDLATEEGEDQEIKLSVLAVDSESNKKSAVATAKVTVLNTSKDNAGTRVYYGTAECPGDDGSPYTVKVKVTTINGVITDIEDNGTIDTMESDGDYAFWEGYGVMDSEGMPDILRGKTLAEVIAAKTVPNADDEELLADAVSGATISSNSVKYAVINALNSEPASVTENTVSAPKLTADSFVVMNKSYTKVDVEMTAEEGLDIRYTLDGSEPTLESNSIEEIGYFKDKMGVSLTAGPDEYPDGRVVLVRAAAFNEDGEMSDVVDKYAVFASVSLDDTYDVGYSEGASGDVQAEIFIHYSSPSRYISSIKLDDDSTAKYREFLDELFAQVYLKQSTEGITIEGHEAEAQKVLDAIADALSNAVK